MDTAPESGRQILVIDDHTTVLDAVEQVLESIGLDFLGAPDGATGISLAVDNRPDLIVCDYYMEGYNGLEVFKALRGREETASIPFILMSMDESVEEKAVEAGVDGFISKGASDLVSTILHFVA